MTFTVQPERLDTWARQLAGLLDDTASATSYANRHIMCPPGGGGVISAAATALDEARDTVASSTTSLHGLLAASAGELERTARHYRETDLAQSLLGTTDSPTGTAAVAPIPDAAVTENPATRLTDPIGTDPVPDAFESVLSLPDLVSPTAWLLWVFENVCGLNPLDHLTAHVAGDWAAFSRAAEALDNLGEFYSATAHSLDTGRNAVITGPSPAWSGEAADAAGEYFARLAGAVEHQVDTTRGLGRECRGFSTGMYQLAKGLADAVKFFLDMAIVAALAAAAGAFTAYTGVGGVLGAAAAITAFAQANIAWIRVGEIISNLYGFANLFVGAMARATAPLRSIAEHPLPAGAYDHPGV